MTRRWRLRPLPLYPVDEEPTDRLLQVAYPGAVVCGSDAMVFRFQRLNVALIFVQGWPPTYGASSPRLWFIATCSLYNIPPLSGLRFGTGRRQSTSTS